MSIPTLVIGNKNYSSWSMRPWLLMRVIGVDFEEQRIALDTDEFRERIGRLSPSRRVPVLHHDGLVVWDSLAIAEYVAETWPQKQAWPAERAARAEARSASAEMHSGFQSLRAELPMDCRRSEPRSFDSLAPGTQRDIERILAMWRACRARFADAGPWLCGTFSAADAMYAPVVLRFRSYGVPVGEVEQAWMNELLALPATRQWLEAASAEREVLAAP